MNCWLNAECLFPLNVSKRPAKRCILSMSKIAWGYQLFLNNPYLGPKLRVKLSLLVNKLRLIFWSLNFVLQIIFQQGVPGNIFSIAVAKSNKITNVALSVCNALCRSSCSGQMSAARGHHTMLTALWPHLLLCNQLNFVKHWSSWCFLWHFVCRSVLAASWKFTWSSIVSIYALKIYLKLKQLYSMLFWTTNQALDEPLQS